MPTREPAPSPVYPPHRPVSALEAQVADREASVRFAIPSLVLMEHAGRGLAALVAGLAPPGRPVVVLCGPGNNGGDGYACARFLRSWGAPVRIVRLAPEPPRGPDARVEHDLAARDVAIAVVSDAGDAPRLDRELEGAGAIVDAMFGIGLARPLAEPWLSWIDRANRADAVRVAADVPSGLDADTGEPMPSAIVAHWTAAMGLPKAGCFTPAGAPFSGRVVEIDIGLPLELHGPYRTR